jgi:hypothetical protein
MRFLIFVVGEAGMWQDNADVFPRYCWFLIAGDEAEIWVFFKIRLLILGRCFVFLIKIKYFSFKIF